MTNGKPSPEVERLSTTLQEYLAATGFHPQHKLTAHLGISPWLMSRVMTYARAHPIDATRPMVTRRRGLLLAVYGLTDDADEYKGYVLFRYRLLVAHARGFAAAAECFAAMTKPETDFGRLAQRISRAAARVIEDLDDYRSITDDE